MVAEALRETGVLPQSVALEVTQSMLLENVEMAISTMNRIRGMGVHIHIDDFGTGYSSLSYLKKLPVDRLKIDRSFVEGIPDDRDDVAIVATILSMARNLGLDVIAEGVENETQLTHLRGARCAEYQGYLLSRPVSPAELEALLDATT
jgi:EAL domain-containing protein (putative c-di-GMP-specific phosphodiesterase class I)